MKAPLMLDFILLKCQQTAISPRETAQLQNEQSLMHEPIELNTHSLGTPIPDGMILGAAIYGLLAGIVLCYIGKRNRLLWIIAFGGLSAIGSAIYLGSRVLGIT